jgi:predicted TIM-barrel fold metal-dependent hydrolase
MLIDAHVHITTDGKWFNTSHDASVDRLLKEMDRGQVDKSVLLPILGTVSNEQIANLCKEHPDRFIGFGSVNPNVDEPNIDSQVDQISSLGLLGLKVHPRHQGIAPLSPITSAILESAAARGLPVVFCGYQQTVDDKIYMDELLPLNYDRLAKRHPNAKIVIAHMGGHRVLDAYFVAKSNPNVYLDTSYVFSALRDTSIYKDLIFVLRNLDRRVIFGSDFPEIKLPDYVRLVLAEANQLEDCDIDAVCSRNLLSILPPNSI